MTTTCSDEMEGNVVTEEQPFRSYLEVGHACWPHPFALTQLNFCLNKVWEVLSPVLLPSTRRKKQSRDRGQQINRKHGRCGLLALFTKILKVNTIKALICGVSAKFQSSRYRKPKTIQSCKHIHCTMELSIQ